MTRIKTLLTAPFTAVIGAAVMCVVACGPTFNISITGYTAVIFQHEIDHLDGILYTDKVVEWL